MSPDLVSVLTIHHISVVKLNYYYHQLKGKQHIVVPISCTLLWYTSVELYLYSSRVLKPYATLYFHFSFV